MINSTDINQNPDFSAEGNSPLNEANEAFKEEDKASGSKLKSYSKKSLSPIIGLIHRYQDDISPYFDAITKGLQAGADSLGQSSASMTDTNDAEKVVAGWFSEAVDGLSGLKSKLQSSGPQDIIDFIESQAQKHPGFTFSSSYLAGLFFGRIGKHIGRKKLGGSWSSGESMTH